jgi:hypothetical protein
MGENMKHTNWNLKNTLEATKLWKMVYIYVKNERRQNSKDSFNRKQNKNAQDQNEDK